MAPRLTAPSRPRPRISLACNAVDYGLLLPNGDALLGDGPVVVVGANGSGKTRHTRELTASTPIEFVNALRNTRVAPELPAMGLDTARTNYASQKNQARSAHWELTSEFDFMLSQLLAEDSMASKEFLRRYKENPDAPGQPPDTALSRVEAIWGRIFPGRELRWRDWKPVIANRTTGTPLEYSGNQMSDGEKAALFVAARVFSAEPGVLVVDEPETHFHSLLAVRLWNALEEARPDLRFVYVTHDMTFALSRRNARYVLARPDAGLRAIELDEELPADVAEELLGSASFSFYASRIVFCEGVEGGLDSLLYMAWFNGLDAVVRPVKDRQAVIRCVQTLRKSDIARSLEAIGIVDRDYSGDRFLTALPDGVFPLAVHEVESLTALPEVVQAVAKHTGHPFDPSDYLDALRGTVDRSQRDRIMIERWKARVEPQLVGVVASTSNRGGTVEALVREMPTLLDKANWSFSPEEILEEEKARVDAAIDGGTTDNFFAIVPGKQLMPIAARQVGMDLQAYIRLIAEALSSAGAQPFQALHDDLQAALGRVLPARTTAVHDPAAAPA